MNRAEDIRAVAHSFLGALVARRDAKRLLDVGFEAATEDARTTLEDGQGRIDVRIEDDAGPIGDMAILLVALKEAADLIELHDRDPKSYPAGRTAAEAFAVTEKAIRRRYARDKCGFCKGPAVQCARRHARGMSCA